MWFKTQGSLVNIEGTAQYYAWRWKGKDGTKSIWVTAHQTHRGETDIKRWFRKPIRIRGQYFYLAAFQDNDLADKLLADCMRRIESSIRNGDAICDLSDVGERSLWERSDRGVPVNWKA